MAVSEFRLYSGAASMGLFFSWLSVSSSYSKLCPQIEKCDTLNEFFSCIVVNVPDFEQLSSEDMIAEFSQLLNW